MIEWVLCMYEVLGSIFNVAVCFFKGLQLALNVARGAGHLYGTAQVPLSTDQTPQLSAPVCRSLSSPLKLIIAVIIPPSASVKKATNRKKHSEWNPAHVVMATVAWQLVWDQQMNRPLFDPGREHPFSFLLRVRDHGVIFGFSSRGRTSKGGGQAPLAWAYLQPQLLAPWDSSARRGNRVKSATKWHHNVA